MLTCLKVYKVQIRIFLPYWIRWFKDDLNNSQHKNFYNYMEAVLDEAYFHTQELLIDCVSPWHGMKMRK